MSQRAAPHRGTDIHYGESDADDRPSKTQLKQHAHALQQLGEAVAGLSQDRFERIEMPESLRDAIVAYRKTRSHEGRRRQLRTHGAVRRQLQYVGKLMHQADEAALREAVAEAELGSARETLALHEAERWRAELIADDDASTRWLAAYPETDSQHLRSLVRAARRDASVEPGARQPRSHRDLFQFIKPLLQP